MKHFLEFSLAREQKIFNKGDIAYLSKSVKSKKPIISFLKPRLFALSAACFPALLLSNGSLVFLNSESFGKIDSYKTGTLLFEDSYSEKDQ